MGPIGGLRACSRTTIFIEKKKNCVDFSQYKNNITLTISKRTTNSSTPLHYWKHETFYNNLKRRFTLTCFNFQFTSSNRNLQKLISKRLIFNYFKHKSWGEIEFTKFAIPDFVMF